MKSIFLFFKFIICGIILILKIIPGEIKLRHQNKINKWWKNKGDKK